MIVVDDTSPVSKSTQFITVPFRLLLTGLITDLDIKGMLLWTDILKNLNTVELTVKFVISTPVEVMVRVIAVVSLIPRITLNLHCSKSHVAVHINSSWPPLHTGATPEGESVTAPVSEWQNMTTWICRHMPLWYWCMYLPSMYPQWSSTKVLTAHHLIMREGFMADQYSVYLSFGIYYYLCIRCYHTHVTVNYTKT
jgi:hypothetical protein